MDLIFDEGKYQQLILCFVWLVFSEFRCVGVSSGCILLLLCKTLASLAAKIAVSLASSWSI